MRVLRRRGATVLEPQFLQELLGYTATNAGKALTAGGIALSGEVMPLAGTGADGQGSARETWRLSGLPSLARLGSRLRTRRRTRGFR